ncbi:MAG TPA: 50S ribosomal protein L30 [Alphaproteobacteria bacterium]|nr:50S ribosomal protein L30 [Alphaproteobacteria bacterium]
MTEKKVTFFYVKQVKSTIARPKDQKATIKGMGLGKLNKIVKLADTPAARGMQQKVHHLTVVVDEAEYTAYTAK